MLRSHLQALQVKICLSACNYESRRIHPDWADIHGAMWSTPSCACGGQKVELVQCPAIFERTCPLQHLVTSEPARSTLSCKVKWQGTQGQQTAGLGWLYMANAASRFLLPLLRQNRCPLQHFIRCEIAWIT